jgi:hypothetical protein
LAVAVLALLAVVGCEKEEIREYQATRVDASRPKGTGALATKRRLLAVIAPQGQHIWVFKFLGPVDEINERAKTFDAFVESLVFDDDNATVKWTAPEGWNEEGPAGMRHATLHAGPKGASPELTVFKLPKSSVLANVNRWRTLDLSLSPIPEAGLGKVTQKRTTKAGKELTFVDMVGVPPRGKGPPMARGRPKEQPRERALTYKAPPGWEEQAPKGGALALVSFRVSEGGRTANVTITQLGREFGGMHDNVNLWRSQVGLGGLSAAEFNALPIPKVTVDTVEGRYLDLSGPKGRMLLVLAPQLDSTYFFKMVGDKDLVAKQKPLFEAFLKTVRFRGAAGADDE